MVSNDLVGRANARSNHRMLKFCLINFSGWAVLSLILTSFIYLNLDSNYEITWSAFYLRQMPWWISASIITPMVYYAVQRTKPRSLSYIVMVHLILFLVIVVSFNFISAIYFTSAPFAIDSVLQTANEARVSDFISNLFSYVIISAVIHTVVAFHDKKKAEADSSQVSKLLTEARLELLTRQLQPHFLFNALNTISSLVRKQENQEAIAAIDNLGNLLRACIEQNARVTVSFEEELRLIKHYISIESIRFRGRLNIETSIDETALSFPVPLLILQPIVENAIKHGISKIGTIGRVLINAKRSQNGLVISVEDNGPGVSMDIPQTGVGIRNTRERLMNLYQNDSFRITNMEGGGTRVVLDIPYPKP